MNRKRWIPLLLVGVLALGGFAAWSTIGSAKAQSDGNGAVAPNPPAGEFGRGERGERGGFTGEELASALGITADELTQAQAEARSAALAQAVKDGLITQAQADDINANGSAFPFGGRWNGWLEARGIDFDAHLAAALGITTDELAEARSKAMDAHLAAMVADGVISQDQLDLMKARKALAASDQFTGAMQSAFESALAQAVKSGVITQAQADLLLARTADRGGFGFGPGCLDEMGAGRRGR